MRDFRKGHGDEHLKVHTDGNAGPYLIVDPSQVAVVRAVLDAAGINCNLTADAIRLNCEPTDAVFNFGVGADSDEIQAVLDAVD